MIIKPKGSTNFKIKTITCSETFHISYRPSVWLPQWFNLIFHGYKTVYLLLPSNSEEKRESSRVVCLTLQSIVPCLIDSIMKNHTPPQNNITRVIGSKMMGYVDLLKLCKWWVVWHLWASETEFGRLVTNHTTSHCKVWSKTRTLFLVLISKSPFSRKPFNLYGGSVGYVMSAHVLRVPIKY